MGEKIMKGLDPGQQVVKIVNDELVKLMGTEAVLVKFSDSGPTVIMMVGLQGAGKTPVPVNLEIIYVKIIQKNRY